MARRLALAFAGVALAGVLVLAALTYLAARSQVSELVETRHAETAAAVAAELGEAYAAAGSWASADLRAARVLAVAEGARLEVRDESGALVAAGPGAMLGHMHELETALGPPVTRPVVLGGETVGAAVLRFPQSGLPPAERELRDALARTLLAGSLAAVLVALLVAAAVAARITRPVRRLTAAAKAVEAGDRDARARLEGEPAELAELGRAFDRMADTLTREDELRRALVADVAHELRTPVAILQGELEALLDGHRQADETRLRSLHDETLRLGRIVEDLGTLAAAEAAALRLERRPVDLARVARDAAEALRPQVEAAELELSTALEAVEVDGDAERLGQVVRNLLTNALKFTPAGGAVGLSVAARNGTAVLEVSDSGPGIPREELPHVFERFWRGRGAARTGGSGVGLAVVDELVRAHGGTVTAESAPGRGARFTVLLPKS